MQWLPLVLLVSTLCFVGAYGIEKRARWAWYGGWIVAFFAAGAIAYYTMGMLSTAETVQQLAIGVVFTIGGAALWTFWAVWWATHREEFLRDQEDKAVD